MRPTNSRVVLSRPGIKITRTRLIVGAVALLAVLGASFGVVTVVFAAVHGDLVLAHPDHVWVKDPVTIKFDQDVDTSSVRVSLTPPTPFTLKTTSNEIILTPKPAWLTARHYTVQLGALPNSRHTSTLTGWHALFLTQPDVAVKEFKAAGDPISSGAQVSIALRSAVTIDFSRPMDPVNTKVLINGQKPDTGTFAWSSDKTAATFTPAKPQPDQVFQLDVPSGMSAAGDPLLAPASVKVTINGLEPSNGSSGITASFQTKTPIEVVIENSGPARPQYGLQQADMVFEYVSEYSISRMTAFYFNNPPSLLGPVRSCRLINIPLNEAFLGITMCSGVSPGTHGHIKAAAVTDPRVPHMMINDYDTGNHFFRSGLNFAPHNLFTDASRALRLRAEMARTIALPTNYTIDPPHQDNGLGSAAAAPTVPLHYVTYNYNASSKTYGRFDHGSVFIDAATHAQLQVKNVILMHVPYQIMPYVEDYSGRAKSVFYNMVGSGSAEIYSDGQMIEATWHMDLTHPIYFTDAQGNFIELNTGLTWIHVLGIGQTS